MTAMKTAFIGRGSDAAHAPFRPYGHGVLLQTKVSLGPSQQKSVQLRPWMPPHPSSVGTVLHIGGGSGMQQAFWKQCCPGLQCVCTGVQTPSRHSFVVSVVPSQVCCVLQVPHDPPHPLAPHAFAGAHRGTHMHCPF